MIFEVGKTYQHNGGARMTIIGRLKTHIYGECLIGECDTGELVPVGETEGHAVNWHEQVRFDEWVEKMTAEEYRQRMIQAFHKTDCDELIALCVLPTEKEFEHLEWLLKNHYKKEV